MRISYDPNLRLTLWPDPEAARSGLRLGLQHAEIVKIGEEEVRFLTGRDDLIEGARALWHDTMVLMAVTRGTQGCIWLTRDTHGIVPGFHVAVVDTTGAGDAFMAGLLAALRDRPDWLADPTALDAVCRFANAVGAITATARGAIPALPNHRAVEAFLAAQAL